MSQRDIDNKLNQLHTKITQLNELINRLGSSFESYKIENKFWIHMISQKTFTEEEYTVIKNVERLWYKLAANMPSNQPLNIEELELLAKHKLIDGAQMAHMLSMIGK